MFLVTSNKFKQLLCVSYIDVVRPEELTRGRADLQALLAELPRGFRLLVNLSQLNSMDEACIPALGELMEVLDQAGVGLVVRVVPDETKDIGFNILTVFHYSHQPQVVTCRSLGEAARVLGL